MRNIAHRGASHKAPENTASALALALDCGADILEVDLRLTADGHLVLCHDENFSRLGAPSPPICQMKRQEIALLKLQAHGKNDGPLFMDEALELWPQAHFNVDLKDPGADIVHAWVKLLQKSGAHERCRTASFRDSTIQYFLQLAPGQPVSMPRGKVAKLLFMTILGFPFQPQSHQNLLQLPEWYRSFRILTSKRIQKWQKKGWEVEVWTVDDWETMKRFLQWGVDGIITNEPSLLQKALQELR
ncbi:MAG: hypothetical protein MI717_11580 [Spirochaetales bacterium]|nr:hypothetical protein [Spirochaetales bacterium]